MQKRSSLNAKVLTFMSIAVIVMTAATQVSAANSHSNEHAIGNNGTVEKSEHENEHAASTTINTSTTATVTPSTTKAAITTTDCDDDKNHGSFVSCVAHEHEGGKTVSIAAKSSIGKHNEDNDDDEDDVKTTITPSASPTVTITTTPSETPTVTPSDTPTATPSVTLTPTPTTTDPTTELQGLIQAIRDLLKKFTFQFHR